MLGLGRASQYAGWWSAQGGPISVTFDGTGQLSYTNRQTPSFTIETGDAGSAVGNWNIVETGEYDLTDYDTLTSFNRNRGTIVMTVKLLWPTTGIPVTDVVNYGMFNELRDNDSSEFYNAFISLQNSNANLQISSPWPGGGSALQLPGSYTQYVDRWLTVVWSASETSASFVSWSPSPFPTSGNAVRIALYDTVTGELLGKQDGFQSYTGPDIANFPTPTPANNSGSYGYFTGGIGVSQGSTGIDYNVRLSNFWSSWGTMFDPLTETNTSWRTTRPSATIGTAVAWQNLQLTNFEEVSGSPDTYYVTTQGQDLYSQADDRAAKNGGWDQTQWDDQYSDTDITTDQG